MKRIEWDLAERFRGLFIAADAGPYTERSLNQSSELFANFNPIVMA